MCSALWRLQGAGYLAMCVLAVALGLYPHLAYVSPGAGGAALPALSILAAGQVLFALVVWPLAQLHRAGSSAAGGTADNAAAGAVELLGWLLATVPFYVAAGWVADATVGDVVRVAMYVAAVWTLPLAAGTWCTGPRSDTGAARGAWGMLLGLLVVALGGPAVYYIAAEFATPSAAAVVARVAPAVHAWQLASFRGSWLPEPRWCVLLWPALAGVAALTRLALRRR
ncbi:MAG: hypothetical protein KGY99_07305 [Phycisphaerae bacterium]|nr:hypothetical protein [Phycisphaerae bacterium]